MNYKKHKRSCLNCGNECKRVEAIYCSNTCQREYQIKQLYKKWESDGKFPIVRSLKGIRNYLKVKKGSACSICGLETWLDKPISLSVDHIDGNSNNSKIDNFRLVCPNCDSTLPTWKGRNRGNGRKDRAEIYRAGIAQRKCDSFVNY